MGQSWSGASWLILDFQHGPTEGEEANLCIDSLEIMGLQGHYGADR
jgi:hypothetical protein